MNIYQSFIGEAQRIHVDDVCIPFDASANTASDTREYELFQAIHEHKQDDSPWGLVSWKFALKSTISMSDFRLFCDSAMESGYDCAFYNPMIGNEALYHNVWEQGEHVGHRGIIKLAQHLYQRAGLEPLNGMGIESFSFCNYFIGNTRFWQSYFDFANTILDELDSQSKDSSEIGKLYSGSGNYHRDKGIPMRVFVIERLFSTFVKARTDVRCLSYQPKKCEYISKFGDRLGMLIYRLSRAKNHAIKSNNEQLLVQWNKARLSFMSNNVVLLKMDDPSDFYFSREYQDVSDQLSSLGIE